MVKLQNIRKSYGDVQAVRDLTLEVQEGEIFVLLGPTGAGKTTTLKITAGLVKPDSGTISMGGKDVTDVPPAFRDISFVFETYNLFPIYNVYDNIAFALRSKLLQLSEDDIRRRIGDAASDLHIAHLLERETKTLSGGETQRVALARALVRQAGLNLFDEPLSNLDLKLREELRVEFKALHKKYRSTIFYVTHDHDSAVSIASRIGILHEGRLHQVDTPENLISNPSSMTVASLINYPAINVMDCILSGNQLCLDKKTPLMQVDSKEAGRIKDSDETKFQIGIKPKNIKIGRKGGDLAFAGKVLHIEYQGYNKVVNVDFEGTPLRLITNESVHSDYGDRIEISFKKSDTFLFAASDGKRVL